MKTSKEVLAVIADKVRDNIINGKYIYEDIQFKDEQGDGWISENCHFDPESLEYRIRPETITINGVEIPKPLGGDEILGDEVYYHVDNSELLYEAKHGEFIADYGIRFVYETKQEAITASKLLFGIKG